MKNTARLTRSSCRRARLLVALALLAPAAAGHAQQFQNPVELKDTRVRFALVGFSFAPLQEKDWFVVSRQPARVALVKKGARDDHTKTVLATAVKLPPAVDSLDKLATLLTPPAQANATGRYRRSEASTAPDPAHQDNCLVLRTSTEDWGALKRSDADFLMLRSLSLVCRHPDDPRVMVQLGYSERDLPDGTMAGWEERAQALLKGFRFDPLTRKKE